VQRPDVGPLGRGRGTELCGVWLGAVVTHGSSV
jgi:hypothetical protein